ncbi:MAG: L,D-transpeptidase family protein [Mogibacterium sp.]|nr:L,D-transpeptidase family protein [Mogibacterium sp.]
MKKFLAILLITLIVVAGAAFGAAYYLYGRTPDKFVPYTYINGMDVSGLTAEEAENLLNENVRGKEFKFIYGNQAYTVPMNNVEFDYSVASTLESASIIDPLRGLLRIKKEYKVAMTPAGSESFLAEIAALPICNNEGKTPPQDAYVDLSNYAFRTVREQVGTEVDPARVMDVAFKNIADGSYTAELADADIVRLPALTVESEEFQQRLKYCKDNLNFRLDLVTGYDTTLITPQEIDEMVSFAGDEPKLNKDRIEKFITDYAGKHNEYNKDYDFATSTGSTVTVRGVTYGKVIDKEALTKDLKAALKAQKPASIEVNWAQMTYSGKDTIGNSYIEVSIDKQHVWCYKDGQLVVECDCVTGAPGHDTAKGVFIIQYVTGPTTLRGNNDDGTEYESPVNCFMPFYGGQGLHGSSGWRSKWGGTIYKTGGSHGCVNCPDAAAKKMADTVGYGYPVVIY